MKKFKKVLLVIVILATFLALFCGCGVSNLESIHESIEELKNELHVREEQEDENQEEKELVKVIYNTIQEFYTIVNDPDQAVEKDETETVINSVTKVENATVVYVQDAEEPGGKPGLDKENEAILDNLAADEIFFVADYEETEIVFTVDTLEAYGDVKLYSGDDEVVAIMNDDGIAGDAYAGDGIYTAVQSGSHPAGVMDYWAQCGDDASNRITLYFFERPTEETVRETQKTVEEIQAALIEIERVHADENGCVAEDQKAVVMEEVAAFLEEARTAGRVLLYQVEGCSVDIKLSSGLSLAYTIKEEGADSIGKDISMTVLTCQPQFTEMGGEAFSSGGAYVLPEGVDFLLGMLDAAAADIDTAFDNYEFSESVNYNEEDVTLELVQSFGPNQVILWHGHGYYGPIVKSCLCTGEPFDWDAYLWDVEYYLDCVSNRIVNGLLLTSDTTIISSGYIEKYCGNLSNSFIYLAACYSGAHSGLAQAFLDKGAEAVVANTDEILRVYNVAMLYETVERMTKVNEETNNYYTLGEALQAAKEVYGASDADSRYGGKGATPVIFGGATAGNFRFGDKEEYTEKGTLTGKVCQAADRSTPVAEASIRIFEGDTLVRTLQADETGNYTVELPAGDYKIEVSATGYVTFNSYASVEIERNTYLETFLLVAGVADEEGTASGRIYNAITGIGVENVELLICNGWNNRAVEDAVATIYTNGAGEYRVVLPLGNYTLNTVKEGYISNTINIVVQSMLTTEQNGAISPISSGNDYRIVLSWGLNPNNLDAHVVGPLSDGRVYHVYYAHKSQQDEEAIVCNLDVDDVTSYGPETITMEATGENPHYYYVHLYDGYGTLGTSEAQVKVYQGENLCATFNVPTNLGDGRYWNVFAVCNEELIIGNTITNMADTSYAGGLGHMISATAIVEEDEIDDLEEDEVTVEEDSLEAEDNSEDNETTVSEVVSVDGAITESGEVSVDEENTDSGEVSAQEENTDSEEELIDEEIIESDEFSEDEETTEPEEVTVEDNELASDEMDEELQRAYDVVLKKWNEAMMAVSNDWDFLELSDYDEFEEQYPDVNLSMLLENEIYSFGFAYAYLDIDENGVEELIIGACDAAASAEKAGEEASEDLSARVISIYGFDGETAVELNPDLRGAYRTAITIYEDGIIWVYDTTGVSNDIYQLYEILEDGFSAEQKICYEVVSKDTEETDFFEKYEHLTDDEYLALIEDKTECALSWVTLD